MSCSPKRYTPRRKSAFLLLLVAAACAAPQESIGPTIVEAQSPAIGADGTLVESVGLETVGGAFTPLLMVGCEAPCEASQIFSTAADNQDQVKIVLYRGIATTARDATPLGQFQITGIPPMERGRPQIAVTLAARGGDLVLAARELTTSRPYKIVAGDE